MWVVLPGLAYMIAVNSAGTFMLDMGRNISYGGFLLVLLQSCLHMFISKIVSKLDHFIYSFVDAEYHADEKSHGYGQQDVHAFALFVDTSIGCQHRPRDGKDKPQYHQGQPALVPQGPQ